MTSAVSVQNLTVSYGQNTVLSSASFAVKTGEFACVVGANGSGKTTLVKAILGLIPHQGGAIKLASPLKRSLGYLPQETNIGPNFPASVQEIVMSGTLVRSSGKVFYTPADHSATTHTLETFGLKKQSQKSFASLSGGQKQKVLLARALVSSPKLLFLDEPSNSLDYKSRLEFYDTLKQLNASGVTIIMITHDLDAHDLIGDVILSVKNQKVERFSTKAYLRSF
ncbi:ATP-binding cassette domain-containing protein [Candidatus Saccharibacteria bacterium]|nr:ATP-binding cassette domain-containing protein [Candidatus Saccharibacteria bacterium]